MTEGLKLYALAYRARRDIGDGWDTRIGVAYLRAHNDHEARGLGIENAEKQLPAIDGWIAHQAVVTHIPRTFWPKGPPDTFQRSGGKMGPIVEAVNA